MNNKRIIKIMAEQLACLIEANEYLAITKEAYIHLANKDSHRKIKGD